MQLAEVTYVPCQGGYGDVVAPRHGGPSAKYLFLEKAKKFLKAVGKKLPPEFHVQVTACPGGPAVPGDASLLGEEGGRVLFISLIYKEHTGDSALYWRIGHRPYATDGCNNWVEIDVTPEEVALVVVAAWDMFRPGASPQSL